MYIDGCQHDYRGEARIYCLGVIVPSRGECGSASLLGAMPPVGSRGKTLVKG